MSVHRLIAGVMRRIWKVCPGFMIDRRVDYFLKGVTDKTEIYGRYNWKEHLAENLEMFVAEDRLKDKAYVDNLVRDILKCYFLYGTNVNEYFTYGFPYADAEKRDTFLSRKRKDAICMSLMGKDWTRHFEQLKDKNVFYNLTSDYFKRDVCKVESISDKDSFLEFVACHPKFISKNSTGSLGKGIEIIEVSDTASAERVFGEMIASGSCFIVEELIQQDARMALWNESSINTVRVPSFRTQHGHRIICPLLRTGRAGSIVDNAGSGGCSALIDLETGELISDGYDKLGHHFSEHPDSHVVFEGTRIPEWDTLKLLVKEIHESLPDKHKYVAFDLALSNKGWCLIEGNWGELGMWQIARNKGLYKEFKDLMLH